MKEKINKEEKRKIIRSKYGKYVCQWQWRMFQQNVEQVYYLLCRKRNGQIKTKSMKRIVSFYIHRSSVFTSLYFKLGIVWLDCCNLICTHDWSSWSWVQIPPPTWNFSCWYQLSLFMFFNFSSFWEVQASNPSPVQKIILSFLLHLLLPFSMTQLYLKRSFLLSLQKVYSRRDLSCLSRLSSYNSNVLSMWEG